MELNQILSLINEGSGICFIRKFILLSLIYQEAIVFMDSLTHPGDPALEI